MKIKGYVRENGEIGIRNHVAIIPASVCASETAQQISDQVEGTVALPHQHGCCQIGRDSEIVIETLAGLGRNPNVASVLIIGLGCEGAEPHKIKSLIEDTKKTIETITIQECGGTLKTIEQGTRIARNLVNTKEQMERKDVDISELTLGIECGGSDATSGIASNPSTGEASDLLLEKGGTSILSETTELIGAEHVLAKRAENQEVSDKLYEIVNRTEQKALEMGVDIRGGQPTPGNIEGGVTTIEEKSLGCIYKAGSAPVKGVLEFGERPDDKGLYVMDTPGQDIESITGMLAGGAQIIVFTTGRGTPTGSPIAPVIKVTGNSKTYENMVDNIDINAGKVVSGEMTLQEQGKEIFDEMVRVSNGKLTKGEILKHQEFALFRLCQTF